MLIPPAFDIHPHMAEQTPTSQTTPLTATAAVVTIPTCEMAELLEEVPLHSPRRIALLFNPPQYGNLEFPDSIYVHCDHETCCGVRRHAQHETGKYRFGKILSYHFVRFICSNCSSTWKLFGLKVKGDGEEMRSGICTKIYQEPTFGTPIPKRLFQIIGESNREYFLQARRAIARGLGIGAYAYYRRIVENTKFDLVSSMLELAQTTGAPSAQIDQLSKAKAETQFSKAIDLLRDVGAIPAILLIDGHNPLALLHDILSEGIHQLQDGECLERAQEAEVVLCEIAERMQIAMTERKNVKVAISSILKRKATGESSARTT